jgi:serine O-acetyltransferase
MFTTVRADIARLTQHEPTRLAKCGVLLFNLGLHAVLLYRLSAWLWHHHLAPVALGVSYLNAVLTGAQISPRARIGAGLVIYHPQGTVIGATTVMGQACTLTHHNVIGQRYGGADRPVIGDYFYAGTGAKILGSITIGHRVQVGANAVVLRSLPDGATAVGIPAEIVRWGRAAHHLSSLDATG